MVLLSQLSSVLLPLMGWLSVRQCVHRFCFGIVAFFPPAIMAGSGLCEST
ncbi:hypothetical protein HNQ59_003778 [Chitinivorax tropicus]|uniref:Uncharacterized protein n=1 Tax=Chitinivorax tropicus TaxID=714531 RepID=A0A840MP92_9PROT|nr:hypothetical protein [Chitinivorax tropicus]